jgi:hypothetical protein
MTDAVPENRTADRIQPLVKSIRDRYRSWVKDLHVEVVGDQVVLYGRAYSYYGKQMIQEEVIRQGRLSGLSNRIEVES